MKKALLLMILVLCINHSIGLCERENDGLIVYWRVYQEDEDKSYVIYYEAETKEYGKILIPNEWEWIDGGSNADGLIFAEIKESPDTDEILFTADIFCVRKDGIEVLQTDRTIPNPETQKLEMEDDFADSGALMAYVDGDLYYRAYISDEVPGYNGTLLHLIRNNHDGETIVYGDVWGALYYSPAISPEGGIAILQDGRGKDEFFLRLILPDGTRKDFELPSNTGEVYPVEEQTEVNAQRFSDYVYSVWMDEQHVLILGKIIRKTIPIFTFGTSDLPIELYENYLLCCDIESGEVSCVLDNDGYPVALPAPIRGWHDWKPSYDKKTETLANEITISGHANFYFTDFMEVAELKDTRATILFSFKTKEVETIFRCGYEPVDEEKWVEHVLMRYGTPTAETELLEDNAKLLEWEKLKEELERQNKPIYFKEMDGKEYYTTSPPVIIWG